MKTAIVEREHLAGICSNWGCIPTKALLRSAEIFHYAQHPGDYGIKIEGSVTPDLKAIVARSRGIAQRMNGGVEQSAMLATLYADLADEAGCGFFDAGSVARTTPLDGVHLDAENTRAIGRGLEPVVRMMLGL